jgi:ParB family chromosome partitioning protein
MKFKDMGKCFNAVRIRLENVVPDPDQPREESGFDFESLEQLGNSMVLEGQLHPIVVRPIDGEKVMIVSGERRWRAAKLRGIESIDCVQIQIDSKLSPEKFADEVATTL